MMMDSGPVLSVYSDGYDYVIAASPTDATQVWEGYIGEKRSEYQLRSPWAAIAPTADLSIQVGITLSGREYTTEVRRMTARAWCVVFGRGFLCSTES
jgi:hypothetical protein